MNWSNFILWLATKAHGTIADGLRRVAPKVTSRRDALIAFSALIDQIDAGFDLYVNQWRDETPPDASHGPTLVTHPVVWADFVEWVINDMNHFIGTRVHEVIRMIRSEESARVALAIWGNANDAEFDRKVEQYKTIKTFETPTGSATVATDVPPTHGVASSGEAQLRERLAKLADALVKESEVSTQKGHTIRDTDEERACVLFGEGTASSDAAICIRAILSDPPPVLGVVQDQGEDVNKRLRATLADMGRRLSSDAATMSRTVRATGENFASIVDAERRIRMIRTDHSVSDK
jgi:hypothetical protein